MHGRKRVKPTAEVEKLRKEKEASKIKEYNGIVAACLEKKNKCEFDNEAFILTTKILSQNPDFYTIWNFRRSILLNEISEDCSEEEKQQKFSSELLFLQEVFRHNPKSYWIFNHRQWCLDTMPNPDWKSELDLVSKMLDMDARNFHGWNYRRYVISKLSCIDSNALNLSKTEFDFTTAKINQNFSNYSAWHQRSKLLPKLVEDEQLGDQGKKPLIDQEFELVKSAFYTDPDDQSAWLYHWWLIGREIRHISILGAYYDSQNYQIILAFDDEIGMLTPFQVAYKNDTSQLNIVEGHWRSVSGSSDVDRMHGSVWIFTLNIESGFNELFVTVKPEWIVPSNSEVKLVSNIQMHCQLPEQNKDTLILMPPQTVAENTTILSTASRFREDILPMTMHERINLLKREIATVKELQEIEPESKWCLQTLLILLRELKYISELNTEESKNIDEEVITICGQLINIDKMRTKRFEDLRSRAIFETATNNLIQVSPNAQQEIIFRDNRLFMSEKSQLPTFTLTNRNLTIIPTPSILLHIRILDLSYNKLTSTIFLSNLIHLQEADLRDNCISSINGVNNLRFLRVLNVQSNLIESWEAVRNGFVKWQGGECKVYVSGNSFINESDGKKLKWEKEMDKIEFCY
ncbi:rab geranylgeranyltransferase alpha subunit [Gigaspora margarita]|uniref:Geranylgeranyl transferase type-2 subunit alpha n=1 Tax=Gigaspora margarita TaxID=4874 RepID=A0A8H4A942_GIGMA|nr:rab geranylgeranyltransferase alpha subunit [Gigaspora margarita]